MCLLQEFSLENKIFWFLMKKGSYFLCFDRLCKNLCLLLRERFLVNLGES